MTDLEIQIYRVIRHRGKDNPISVPTLTAFCSRFYGDVYTELNVRQTVRSLIMEHGELIGSTTNQPSGYYLITDPEEIEENYQSLKKRALKDTGPGS